MPEITPSSEAELDISLHDIYSEAAIQLTSVSAEEEIANQELEEAFLAAEQRVLKALELYVPEQVYELQQHASIDEALLYLLSMRDEAGINELPRVIADRLRYIIEEEMQVAQGADLIAGGIVLDDLSGTLQNIEELEGIKPEFRAAFVEVAHILIPDSGEDEMSLDAQLQRMNHADKEREAAAGFIAFREKARPIIDTVFAEYCDLSDPAYRELRLQLIPHLHIGYDVINGFYQLASPLGLTKETYAAIIYRIQIELERSTEQE